MKALTEPNEEVVLSRLDWARAHGPARPKQFRLSGWKVPGGVQPEGICWVGAKSEL